jgi:ligand-binding SRPBCC domain-containing protein
MCGLPYMRLTIKTPVEQSYREVFEGFTFELFQKLTPTFPRVIVKRFDGCRTGDEVHIEMELPVLNRTEQWISRIVRDGEIKGNSTYNNELYFVDEGTTLPFFLSYWRHMHRIVSAEGGGSVIIDDIEYRSKNFLTPFVYPVILAQFAARSPVYKEYFKR